MLTEQAANDIARVILDNWDDWEAIAGQDAQQAQHPQAWRDTMLKNITKTIWRGCGNDNSESGTCGQSVVSNNVGSRTRRNLRGKRGRTVGNEHFGLSGTEGDRYSGRYSLGQRLAVAIDFAGGHFEGEARVVRIDSLCVEFDWNGTARRIYIAETDVVQK
jgi:hypothetical protein